VIFSRFSFIIAGVYILRLQPFTWRLMSTYLSAPLVKLSLLPLEELKNN